MSRASRVLLAPIVVLAIMPMLAVHAATAPRPDEPVAAGDEAARGEEGRRNDEPDARAPLDEEYAGRLREIAKYYRAWGRVDDLSRFAPELCIIPPPATGKISVARTGPHGRKLYYLYAKQRSAYLEVPAFRPRGEDAADEAGNDAPREPVEIPADQVIVKEAFHAVACEEGESPTSVLTPFGSPIGGPAVDGAADRGADGDETKVDWDAPLVASSEAGALVAGDDSGLYVQGVSSPYAARDGKLYRAGALRGLYVMARDADAARTDAGWWYGTILADGTVTAAGRIASCMRCHEEAGPGRLFGHADPELLVNPLDPTKYFLLLDGEYRDG